MPLRLLHVSTGNLYGGVENTLVTLAECTDWDTRLERSVVLCFPGRLADSLAAAGKPPVLIGPVRARFPWQIARARSRLRAFLASEHFDAAICHMPWSQAMFGSTIRRAGIPQIFWMHDAAKGTHWTEAWARRSRPDFVICNSKFTVGTLPLLYPQMPPHGIIIYPVAKPPITLSGAERAALRAEYGASASTCVIIQVSRLEPYKGHSLHLSALARLAALPGWTCWIVGGSQRPHEDTYLTALRAQAKRAGIADRVRFLGERHDVRGLLAAADVFCQPNLEPEPFGIVFVEALYAGVPPVSTAMGGALEIITNNCGRLVPPADPDALAATLRELIEQPALRSKLSLEGPARADHLSNPDKALAALEKIVQNLVHGLSK
jgi:glycosyltransferase involved in cell wall biosynthesis